MRIGMPLEVGRITSDRDDDVGLALRQLPTPLGPMLAVADDRGILMLEFVDGRSVPVTIERLRQRGAEDFGTTSRARRHLAHVERELAEYFAGSRQTFSVPLAPQGTNFQRRAWEYLQTIPFGQTRSYGQQARALGDPKTVRAVGQANGANPLAIVVPCHRVIGAGGGLTGYAAGLERKRWLLAHEQQVLGHSLFSSCRQPASSPTPL